MAAAAALVDATKKSGATRSGCRYATTTESPAELAAKMIKLPTWEGYLFGLHDRIFRAKMYFHQPDGESLEKAIAGFYERTRWVSRELAIYPINIEVRHEGGVHPIAIITWCADKPVNMFSIMRSFDDGKSNFRVTEYAVANCTLRFRLRDENKDREMSLHGAPMHWMEGLRSVSQEKLWTAQWNRPQFIQKFFKLALPGKELLWARICYKEEELTATGMVLFTAVDNQTQ